MFTGIPQEYLRGSTSDFIVREGADLLGRWKDHAAWWQGRLDHGVDPYGKFTTGHITTVCKMGTRDGKPFAGVNFGSQEYLNLASHPAVHAAAKAAIDEFGVHSAGSAALMGNTERSRELESRLAAFLGYTDCTVFPTGWGAGYGSIRTLVGPDDHVVIDVLAHACLQEGARNATKNVHLFPHLSNEAVGRRLERIRREYPTAGILVVTETVFSMDSDVPDLLGLRSLCDLYNATLFVDAAHDLGALGPTGRGHLENQGAIGLPDIVMGSFSKTFASNGGFVACNTRDLKTAFRFNCGPLTFTNALSAMQCAIILKCLDIVESQEGADLRSRLMANILHMRTGMQAAGFELLGQPSAIVPAIIGESSLSRLTTRYLYEAGAVVNLVEFPAVSKNTCRWRLQVMARHGKSEIDTFLELAAKARKKASAHLNSMTPAREPSLV